MTNYWTDDEVNYLIENFPDNSNKKISMDMGRSIRSIISKSNRLGLRKSVRYISNVASIRNKKLKRDLSFENLKEISKKYKTKSEFQMDDPSAYVSARKMGVLDDICSHMIKQNFSIPQLILKYLLFKLLNTDILYNSRRIINPYELDIYIPKFKLAFEYNGRRWHENDIVDKYKICMDSDILLITIKETSRRYESDIKNKIIKNLDIINHRCSTYFSEHDINAIDIDMKEISSNTIDDIEIVNICSRYSNFSKFRSENLNLYNKLIKRGLLSKYTSHMNKRGGITEDLCIDEISKYVYLSEFLKESYRFYIWIKKNKKEYLLKPLKLKQNKKLKF